MASEVNALAGQSAKAAEQIRAQIAATQPATEEAVGAIDTIRATIQGLDEVASAIAAAVEEQAVVTRQVREATQAVA